MKEGTSQFIECCLNKIGIKKKATEWKVIPLRSHYFTDYPSKSENWNDRWIDGWMIKVIADSPIQGFNNSLSRLPVQIDATDTTWYYDYIDPGHDRAALLVSVFKKSDVNINSTKDILIKEIHRKVSTESIAIEFSVRSLAVYYQLRILLQGIRFPDWVEVGDQLLEFCKELGGIVNYRYLK